MNQFDINSPEIQGFMKYATTRMEYIAGMQQEMMEKQALSPELLLRAAAKARSVAKSVPSGVRGGAAKYDKAVRQAEKFEAAAAAKGAPKPATEAATGYSATHQNGGAANPSTGTLETIKKWIKDNPGKAIGGAATGSGTVGTGIGAYAMNGSGYDDGFNAGADQTAEQLKPYIEQLAATYKNNDNFFSRLMNLFAPSTVTPDMNSLGRMS